MLLFALMKHEPSYYCNAFTSHNFIELLSKYIMHPNEAFRVTVISIIECIIDHVPETKNTLFSEKHIITGLMINLEFYSTPELLKEHVQRVHKLLSGNT